MDTMNDRLREVLKSVVVYHIRLGVPIGSRTITKLSEIGLSPATIRNVMADLEELGYLMHPHTSAGRVPTEKGYRFYVDQLLGDLLEPVQPINWPSRPEGPADMLHNASRLLSHMTNYAGVALAPKPAQRTFKQIEFVGLRPRQVLAIFVSEEGLLHQTLFELDRDVTVNELSAMSEYLNQRFGGLPLHKVKAQILEDMRAVKERYDWLLRHALQLGQQAIDTAAEGELYLEGTTNILTQANFDDLDELKRLFKAFEEKYQLLKILEQCAETPGVQVYIGSENAALGTRTCSLVASTYECDGRPIGSVGVIGPTRMDYSTVIPLVQSIAQQLSRFFGEWREGPAR
ncbi:MAG: heat-inducible transcriptional repressor HrcA [Nitrospirota bacterium]